MKTTEAFVLVSEPSIVTVCAVEVPFMMCRISLSTLGSDPAGVIAKEHSV